MTETTVPGTAGEPGVAAQAGAARRHLLGCLLVILSSLAFGLAGILTKLAAADLWTTACWRGLFGGGLVLIYVAWKQRRDPWGRRFRMGYGGWLLAVVGALSSLAFIAAFQQTYIANVVVIYATAPFLAAVLGWCLLRERLRGQTLLAAMASFAGVVIVVQGGIGGGRWLGDLLAGLMTFGCVLYIVLIRKFNDASAVALYQSTAFHTFTQPWQYNCAHRIAEAH